MAQNRQSALILTPGFILLSHDAVRRNAVLLPTGQFSGPGSAVGHVRVSVFGVRTVIFELNGL